MAINVNHNINFNSGDFEQVFNNMTEKLSAIVNTINTSSGGGAAYTPTGARSSERASSETVAYTDLNSKIEKSFDKGFAKFKDLDLSHLTNRQLYNQVKRETTKLSLVDDPKANELIKSLNDSVRSYNKNSITSEQLTERLKDIKSQLPPKDSGGGLDGTLAKGIITAGAIGAMMKLSSTFAAQGSIAGSASQSLNTGVLNSTGFVNDYQSKMLTNKQEMMNTLVGAGLGIAGALAGATAGAEIGAIGGPVGAALGGGVGAAAGGIYSYFGNKNTQQDIASNQFMLSQDENAWRMRNVLGYGSTGTFQGKQLGVNIGGRSYGASLSSAQSDMYNDPSSAAFASYLPDYAFNANRQQSRKEGNMSGNVKDLVTGGKLLGVGDNNIGQFMSLVTTSASVTGQTTNQILNQMLEMNKRYGGDTAKNTALAVQLMQTSHVGNFDKSMELVNRYQYNPSALQNLVNASNTTPMNKWTASQLGSLVGVKNGNFTESQIDDYRRAQALPGGTSNPKYLVYDMIASLRGQNLNVSESGVMNKISTSGGNPLQSAGQNLPASMQAFSDTVIDSLKNLKVDTQNVTVTGNLYLQGGTGGTAFQQNTSSKPDNTKLYDHSGSGTTAKKKNEDPQYGLDLVNKVLGSHYTNKDLPKVY